MTIALLTTRLYVPPVRPEWVPRPHLLELLDAGLWQGSPECARRLTLLSAPAGAGKTALIAAWLSAIRPAGALTSLRDRVAWLSLDEADNDPLRFLGYLLAALQTVDRQYGQEVPRLLERVPSVPAEAVITALINDIAAQASPVILVLDDYHAISDLAIHEAVGLLLERQPPHMHLVISTRYDPPLPLSRLRGRAQMTELRQSDLRLTQEEAAAFFTRTAGIQLPPPEIAALVEHTEGWVTGLQLAALSMQGRDQSSISRFVAGFSGRHRLVLDYLTDEVLRHQPQPLQTFMLQTSILERMCGALCDAVTGQVAQGTGQRLLEQLEAANLFVVPLDQERHWFRYHHLFADLLRAHLQETLPNLIPELHRRAAAWYEKNGFSAEAVHHAQASGDDDLAAGVVERAITRIDTWSRTSLSVVRGWLSALPDEAVQPRPRLRLFMSRVMFISGQPELGSKLLEALEQWLHEHPSAPDAARTLGLTLADRASYAAMLGHVRLARELAQQIMSLAPEGDPLVRFRLPAILGMAELRAGNVVQAQRFFAQAVENALAAGLGYAAVPFLCYVAETEIAQGRLQQAMRTCEQADELAAAAVMPSSSAGFVALEVARIAYERNDLVTAQRRLAEGLELLVQSGISESYGSGHALLARVYQALGDGDGALAAAREALQIAEHENIPRVVGLAAANLARIQLAQGQLDLALRWADQYRESGETEYLREFEDLTRARVLLADGHPLEALTLLDALLASSRQACRLGTVIEIQLLRAVMLPAPDEALQALREALALAEPEGIVRPFVEQGDAMRDLLREAAKRGVAPRYAGQLLTSFRASGESVARAPQPLAEPLTDRELEVLSLLAEGLANREIGQRLFISLPTVKSHTRNLYDKLGVHGRAAAVMRARALGLLPGA